jgi:hypothetical protein
MQHFCTPTISYILYIYVYTAHMCTVYSILFLIYTQLYASQQIKNTEKQKNLFVPLSKNFNITVVLFVFLYQWYIGSLIKGHIRIM